MAGNPSSVLALTVKGDAQGKADAKAVEKSVMAKDYGYPDDVERAENLNSCLTDPAKASKIKADPSLSAFDTGLPDANAAEKFQKIIATDRTLLNKAIEICSN